MGENPNYVPLSGVHLRQTLLVIGIDGADVIEPDGKYMLRCDVARSAKEQISEKLNR